MNALSKPLEDALERGDTVVTPTPQQAVSIRRAWSQLQRSRGLQSWPTPLVFPLHGWLVREWRRSIADDEGGDIPHLLSPVQERALWERIVQAHGASNYLQPAGLSQAAMRAWQKLQEWGIPPDVLLATDTEEARSFQRWTAEFIKQTQSQGWIDSARALWRVPLSAELPKGWIGVGFDAPSVSLQGVVERLRARGVDARLLENDATAGGAVRIALNDPEDELRAAACWARDRLLADATVRLLIVVPELERRRTAVRRIFDEVLTPASLTLMPGDGSAPPYAIEGGVPLADYPLVNAALTALEMVCGRVPFETASQWLRSPFLLAAAGQSATRAQFDVEVRESAPHEVNLRELCKCLEALGDEEALAALVTVCREFEARLGGGRRSLSQWSAAIDEALRELGWPGERALDSAEYQTIEKFHSALGEMSSLDEMIGTVDCPGAVRQLRRVLQAASFQPQTPDCPLDITSRAADPALQYDGVWIVGWHAGAWPRAPRLDPFLPWQAQLAAGIPEASAASALSLAEKITARLFASAPQVIVSWPQRLDDEETLPSPLIANLPLADGATVFNALPDYRHTLFQSAKIETGIDGRAPPLAVPVAVSGGARTLMLQSQCPFRAFAERRLGADVPESPEPGIDAATRGSFTHRALKLLWDQLGSQAGLAALDAAARRQLFEKVVARSAHEVLEPPRCWSAALIELEYLRLVALLEEFAGVELQRAPFRVLASEQRIETAVAGLELRLSIDRIDELEDGRRVVIDYKTGGITPKAWHGDRPDDPQLPLYAVASQPRPSAVAFAFLRADGCNYKGASEHPVALKGLEPSPDWPVQLEQWRAVIERLAAQFAAGVAQVDPSSRRVCTYCHLHALCRIDEIDGPQPETDGEE